MRQANRVDRFYFEPKRNKTSESIVLSEKEKTSTKVEEK